MTTRSNSIIKTLLLCLVASLLAATLKIIYGWSNNSLAFLADGIHSVFDSASTILGIISVRYSYTPPDKEHPYGHQKFEILSTLSLGLLLFLAAYEVGSASVHRFFATEQVPTYSVWGIVLLGITMLINLAIAAVEKKQANKLESRFLAADSIHNRSDFLITCAVFATLLSAYYKIRYVDAVASMLITLYLIYLAISIILFNMNPLVDRSILDEREVQRIVNDIPGVLLCHHVRSRGEKNYYFLDLNIHLPGNITLERAHEITHAVEQKLKAIFPGLIDVVIHTEPHGHAPCWPPQ